MKKSELDAMTDEERQRLVERIVEDKGRVLTRLGEELERLDAHPQAKARALLFLAAQELFYDGAPDDASLVILARDEWERVLNADRIAGEKLQ